MSLEAKKLYDALKDEGILKEVYGKKMTGNWTKDEKLFMEAYKENEKLFGLEALDLDQYLDDPESNY